jgi:predicted amidohydrolase
MPRIIKTAVVQMDITPALTLERLERAERWVVEAAQAGAQLVVLPELFNTGYAYRDANYQLSEPFDGMTATWMKKTATRLGVHLAGSFLLREPGGIYNALLLFDPSGRSWRYDKNYPWAWERGYFRERHGITVAHTELGDLGMMLCWDAGHLNLWKSYAGKVDLMLMSSCPPDGGNPTYYFPDGASFTLEDFGPAMAAMKHSGPYIFGELISRQTAWLGVPAVNSGSCGHFQSAVPRSAPLVWGFSLTLPRLTKHFAQASQLKISCDMIPSCKAFNAEGEVIAKRTQAQGEGFLLAEVMLADRKHVPMTPQPPAHLPYSVYFNADVLVPFLMKSVYRKGLNLLGKTRTK